MWKGLKLGKMKKVNGQIGVGIPPVVQCKNL